MAGDSPARLSVCPGHSCLSYIPRPLLLQPAAWLLRHSCCSPLPQLLHMPSYSPTPRCSPRPRLRHVPSRGEAPHTPLRTHSCALARLSHSPPLLQVPAAFPSPILSCATRLAVTPVPKASDLAVPRPGYSPSLLPLSPGSLGKSSTRFPSVPATPRAPATAKAQLPRILPPNSSSSCPQILLELTDSPDSITT